MALTATPTTGFVFAGWLGDCSGTGECRVAITHHSSVTATFTSAPAAVPASGGKSSKKKKTKTKAPKKTKTKAPKKKR